VVLFEVLNPSQNDEFAFGGAGAGVRKQLAFDRP
jgi:hypothetical protein